jgi:hypothetical protein
MSKTVMIVEDNELNMKLFHDLLVLGSKRGSFAKFRTRRQAISAKCRGHVGFERPKDIRRGDPDPDAEVRIPPPRLRVLANSDSEMHRFESSRPNRPVSL